jgi:hypothetical protein
MLKNIGAVFIFLTALITGVVFFSVGTELWFLLGVFSIIFAIEIIAGATLLWLHWRGYYEPYPEKSNPLQSSKDFSPSSWRLFSIFNGTGLVVFLLIGFGLASVNNELDRIPFYLVMLIILNSFQYLLVNLYKAIKKRIDPYRRRVLS